MVAVDTLHNQDKVIKESLSLFKNRSLDFLDASLTDVVVDILSTEITETVTKKAFADNAFKLSNNKGLHSEWESDVDESDMIRFASYHIDLTRKHGIPFITIVITTKKPRFTNYTSPSMVFTPQIINLKDRDADKVLAEIDRKLNAGEHDTINELELVYLPLYGSTSGKGVADLLDIAIKLTSKVANNDKNKQQKLQDLLVLLTATFISIEELNKILEVNMRVLEDNPAVKFFQEWGMRKGMKEGMEKGMVEGIEKGMIEGVEKGIEKTILSMINEGFEFSLISKITGFDTDRIKMLEQEMLVQA
jgi:hypothetical protein